MVLCSTAVHTKQDVAETGTPCFHLLKERIDCLHTQSERGVLVREQVDARGGLLGAPSKHNQDFPVLTVLPSSVVPESRWRAH